MFTFFVIIIGLIVFEVVSSVDNAIINAHVLSYRNFNPSSINPSGLTTGQGCLIQMLISVMLAPYPQHFSQKVLGGSG